MKITINCAICAVPMEREIEDGIPAFIVEKLQKMTVHDTCAEARAIHQEAERATMLVKQRAEKWKAVCPPLYHMFDRGQCGNLAMSDRIANWEPAEGMGLAVVGPSRSGKTRAVFRMLERKFMQGKTVFFCSGPKWTIYAVDAAKGDIEAKRAIERAQKTDLTFIDDFAKASWTERVEAEFWNLMETRAGMLRPVVLTSTERGEELTERMGQASRDIIGRIREFCEPVIWR